MTKSFADDGALAIFCNKCGRCFEDTVGRVSRIQEETFDSDLYHVSSYVIDFGLNVMSGLEFLSDYCRHCAEEDTP